MDVRRAALSIVVVLAVALLVGCCPKCPEVPEREDVSEEKLVEKILKDTRYVVIVPPEDGIPDCRVIPFERHMIGFNWVTFVNLADEPIHFFVSSQIAEKDEKFTLDPDQSHTVKIRDLEEANISYTVTSNDGGCFPELPTPKVIIP